MSCHPLHCPPSALPNSPVVFPAPRGHGKSLTHIATCVAPSNRVSIPCCEPFRDSLGFHSDPHSSRRARSLARRRTRQAPSRPGRANHFSTALSLRFDDCLSVAPGGGYPLAVLFATLESESNWSGSFWRFEDIVRGTDLHWA